MKKRWRCPTCRREFSHKNQRHSCEPSSVACHLKGKSRTSIILYKRIEAMAKNCGPITVVATKNRIAFQARTIFASVIIRRSSVVLVLALARRISDNRFHRVEILSDRHRVHYIEVSKPEEVDSQLNSWMREAYLMGAQEHLRRVV